MKHRHWCAGCSLDGNRERDCWWACITEYCSLNQESLCGQHRTLVKKDKV